MKTEFKKVKVLKEIPSLVAFDHKTFRDFPADWFEPEFWRHFECWWLLVDKRKAGCCAFEVGVDFQQDVRRDGRNPRRQGSLYVASTGILPDFQGQGLGILMKSWQIAYARHHGFTRMVTNTRKSNKIMIGLNRKFGFKVVRTTPGYYLQPVEATVVLELQLGLGL